MHPNPLHAYTLTWVRLNPRRAPLYQRREHAKISNPLT